MDVARARRTPTGECHCHDNYVLVAHPEFGHHNQWEPLRTPTGEISDSHPNDPPHGGST